MFVGVWVLLQGFQVVGASVHYFDYELHPDITDPLLDYKELQRLHKVVLVDRHILLGTATDTASGVSDDTNDNRHRVVLPGLVVPGLRPRLFSVSPAAKTGLATLTDSRPRLEQGQHVLPLQLLDKNKDMLSFDLCFILTPMTAEPSRNTAALHALQTLADFWNRRMGHVNPRSLRIYPVPVTTTSTQATCLPLTYVRWEKTTPKATRSTLRKEARHQTTSPTSASQITMGYRRQLEKALRQKNHRPEMTRANHHPTRLRQKRNFKAAS